MNLESDVEVEKRRGQVERERERGRNARHRRWPLRSRVDELEEGEDRCYTGEKVLFLADQRVEIKWW